MGLTVGVYFKKDILILRLRGELDEVSVGDLRMKISNYIDSYKINHLIINLDQLKEEGLISDYQDTKPDVLILEALTLADNGNVEVEDNHDNISTIIQELQSINEDLYVILMPTHPIPNATIYPKQVDALKEYAAENDYTYIDHWEAWPDYTNEAELMEYLNEDKSAPNEKGIEIWSKEVLKLFGI